MNETMTLHARVSAPVAAVHHALTDADTLRIWLAEHVEVDLPHRYEFWGRYTPQGDAPHQRLLHVDDHTVRFAWLIGDEDTTVELSLAAEDADTTIVTVSQTHFPGWQVAVTEANVRGFLQTYWCLSLANLVDHLEGRPLTPKCDFTTTRMHAQVAVDAVPDAVFDSLVDPAKFSDWFGANVAIEPHVGGRWAMGSFDLDPDCATITAYEPGSRLTLQWADGLVAGWELEGSAGQTRLTIVQSGFDDTRPPYGAWMGWLSGIAELRRYHELPQWRPVWLDVEVPGIPEGILTGR